MNVNSELSLPFQYTYLWY